MKCLSVLASSASRLAGTLGLAIVAFSFTAFADIAMPRIMSHRGESNDRPENTMAAFRLAFERGVDGVECDVYATTDNVPVIIHDSTTARTAGSGTNLTVTASSWNDLKDVRVGAFGSWIGTEWEGETLQKLEDYLALLSMNSTTRCIIELKGNGANHLVSNVVEVVKAQPLATSDRVVFIAFTHSLISEVRTALPDYEAWLLVRASDYSGSADLISKIQTYNATGVDVQATATFSAEDVAAVKAAGYAFAVWTCDNDNTALALAQKGVEEIATNRGGEMKANLAALIADYNNRYAEISEPNFPAGITLMEPSAYVQTGLVGHFDGIRNAGANLPHDPSTRTWKNLASGYPDAPFTGNGGYWTADGKGFYFDGSSVYARLSSPGIDLNHETATIQLVLDTPTSQQATGSGVYPGFFYSSDNDDFGIFINNNNTKGTKSDVLIWKAEPYSNKNRPQIDAWAGKYATAIFTHDYQYLFDGTAFVNGKSRSARNDKAAKQFSWGGSARETANRYVKGTYYSVRIYNATLTEDELKWNRVVDEVRFRNVVTNGTVVVSSNRAGADGTETSGTYYVNGNHTFTAPATVTIDGCVYTNAGYKLERWNPTGKGWDFDSVVASTSFAYTNCEANTGARITWNWGLKSGVKKIDADDYVQGGLLLGFDGIRNAGLGVAHDNSATTWANIGSLGGDATPETFDATLPGAWTAKGYRFTGGDCFVTPVVKFGRQVTMQVAVDYNESLQTATSQFPSPFGANADSKDYLGIYSYRKYATDRGDEVRFYTRLTDQLPTFSIWDGRFVNAISDYHRASATSAAAPVWTAEHAFNQELAEYSYCIGVAWKSVNARLLRSFSGVIHAARLYDRVLTEAEIAHNMEIDNIRFYAGAGRHTGTHLVEVAVESPGGAVTVDEAGCWIVRGENASKTFTAPASVTVGNNTYSCTGYRLETWNASKRMWENPVETASATTVALSATEQNRRLTWLYTLTSGIRSAADYDVGDYVQKGLVANYDGIRNLGPGNGHATMAQRWRDSSYRDVPMIAASNSAHRAWVGFGHHFTAAEESFFEMTEPISLGQNGTVQGVLDVSTAAQTTSYPLYFGFGNSDYSFFTRYNNKQRLESKYTDWVGGNLYQAGWEGKYFTWMMNETTHWLVQGTTPGAGTARTKTVGVPEKKFAIGAPNTYTGNDRKNRCMTGDYYALRIYNRALTEAELAHNRTVDEIRYRGNFTNANVTVVCEVPFEGVEAPVSMPAGDYEVAGSFTFTANSLTVSESTFPVRYTIETWDGSEWGEPEACEGSSYTYTAGGAKVRLTWKWADPTVPVKATWSGLGDANDLLDPNNWVCVNASGETISAAPTNVTTVVIDGTTGFSIPDGVTTFPWKEIKFGSPDAHAATRCGNYKIATSSGFTEAPVGMFAVMSAANTSLANLNGGNTSWQTSNLKTSRVRYDGWFYVAVAQAGTWTVTQMFDDYFGFAIDGEWIVINPNYVNSMTATVDVPEGWHRFTIVCGDSTGSYGSTDTSCVVVNGVNAPMSISWGGAAVTFTDGNFTFGGEVAGTVTLTNDCDWTALGNVLIANGATIDLNGHNLTLASVSADAIGATITNSNDAVTSTITFVAGEGSVVTNNGAAICGNVKVVKKGTGTYYAYANACTYSGGTFIDEGKAQPPDGNGADTLYSYDQFKAFGTNEIVVASNAVFDIRANYAYRSRVVLAGGTLTNTKADMKQTGWGGSGIGRLDADSTNRVPYSIVFGDNNGKGDMDLNGHTLTVLVGSGRRFYLRCAKIENGKMDFAAGDGWFQVVNACTATNVDFRINSALAVSNTLSVCDYEAVWASNTKTHNEGKSALNVYGTFTPAAGQKFYGCTMQDGSTIDLSGQSGTFSTLSYYTTGSTNVQFAANANVTVNLAGRTDLRTLAKNKELVMSWPEGLGPAASVKFQVDAETKAAGFKVVRDDENNGLRFMRKVGIVIIVQ